MIKRDNLLHIILRPDPDQQGGSETGTLTVDKTYAANISVSTSIAEVVGYGLKKQLTLHATTNYELPTGTYDRYLWNNKIFRCARQTQFANEWNSMLIEEGDARDVIN